MKITKVKVKRVENDAHLLAFSDVVIDNAIVIHGIKLIKNEDKLFLSFPSVRQSDHYQDIVHPLNQEVRQSFEDVIISAYYSADTNEE